MPSCGHRQMLQAARMAPSGARRREALPRRRPFGCLLISRLGRRGKGCRMGRRELAADRQPPAAPPRPTRQDENCQEPSGKWAPTYAAAKWWGVAPETARLRGRGAEELSQLSIV